ncbi:MAG: GatB/YqeY domain-containing protein [Pseudomonadota bacterium]|nr:GatB/YqeY domain-containing protein [Pseudomonadota bacterium]
MALKEVIMADMKSAMREKDSTRLNAIRLLRAALQRRELDDRTTLDDDGVVAVVQKMIKQSRDSIAQFKRGGRDDLILNETTLVQVLERYLPEQINEAVLIDLVIKAIADTGADNMRDIGKVMAKLKPAIQGRADLGQVSAIVKQKLNS